jgi:hypothetical protein
MKRFTETQKWEDPWFRKLKPEMKLLWIWVLDKCDNAGVVEPDIDLASFQIGYTYPMDTLSEFNERIVNIDADKWFIPKFIAFQYGKLSPDCKAHNPVFSSLEKHNINATNLQYKGYAKGINTLKDKDKEKDKEKDNTKSEKLPFDSEEFKTAWDNWKQHRIEIKKKLTPTTTKSQLKNLADMGEVKAIATINHTIKQGWQGLYEPDADKSPSTKNRFAGIQEEIELP